MDESEFVAEYFDKVQELVNAMRACKDGIIDQYVVDKILRSLTPRFDHVVVDIEETRDLETLEIEELQHSLEEHEQPINERRHCQEQELQSEDSSDPVKGQKKKSDEDKEWKFDKKKVRCYNCKHFGHFPKECWKGDGAKNKPKERVHLAQDDTSDSEVVMLMANTNEDQSNDVVWYLDSGCSTHMTRKKEWFVKMKKTMQGRIKFSYDRSLTTDGSGRVGLRVSDGREVVIDEVLEEEQNHFKYGQMYAEKQGSPKFEVVLTTTYILNRSPTKRQKGITPEEAWFE
ncbi:uncharacterized protein LOC124820956, partial [Vigna umbellata]|uniref:uncharacterized protein LOC124820956 n=1 Tax=Vigna umbellata TaxID=87088 RepID=UPI001F5F896B